jgi:large repetitive protein
MIATLPQNWAKALSIFAVLLTHAAVSIAQPVVAPIAPACAGSISRLSVTSTAPAGFYYAWYKDMALTNLLGVGSTYTTNVLTSTTTFYVAQVNGPLVNAATLRTPVTVTVNPVPGAPVAGPVAACYGQSIAIVATAPAGATVNWYAVPSGAAPFLTGNNTYNTPPLTQPTTYYAKSILNGCASSARTVGVSINQLPATPASASKGACVGTTVTLNATGANNLTEWTYTPVGGGASITGTGVSFTTPVLSIIGNNNVKVRNVSAQGCKSPATTVYAIGRAVPAAPAVAPENICSGTTATLIASNGTPTTEWHSVSATGAIVGTGANFITPALSADITYFAINNNGGCKSTDAPATVTVTTLSAPTATNTSVCEGDRADLTATGATGATIAWFADLNGGTRLGSVSTYTTPMLAQTTSFYAQQSLNGCTSPIKEIKVSVNPAPAAPLFTTNPTICGGSVTTLRLANGNAATQWYSSIFRTDLDDTLGVGASYTTPIMAYTQTFYVRNVSSAGCKSDMASQVVTVNNAPLANAGADRVIKYGETAQFDAAGGLFYKWSPATLVDNPNVFNPTTAERLNVGTTLYTVTVTNAYGCTDTDSVLITVTADPVQAAFPNVITPNGDGQNDVLMLPFLGEKISSDYTLTIYARAGNVVLSTTNYQQDWDAKDLPDDTYWYVLTYKGDKKDYRGFITVRR